MKSQYKRVAEERLGPRVFRYHLSKVYVRRNVIPGMSSEYSDGDLRNVIDTILATRVPTGRGCPVFRDCFDIAEQVQVDGVVDVRAKV
jgi:hypothetical protein